jgi:predicted RNA binding protein YcfA (HicA-like mRNA interferase family)
MAKAARVLAALKRDGWVEVRRKGSHRWLAKGERRGTWAWHDGDDLGGPAVGIVAKEFGYSVDELRKL